MKFFTETLMPAAVMENISMVSEQFFQKRS